MNANGSVTTVYSATYGITIGAGTGILIHHNYVKVNNSGIRGDTIGANATIEYNEVDSPASTLAEDILIPLTGFFLSEQQPV